MDSPLQVPRCSEIQAWADSGAGLPSSVLDALPIANYDTLEARGIASFNSIMALSGWLNVKLKKFA